MSFSSHRKKLLDESAPLEHRASHARSCALHVAEKLGVKREMIIEMVAAQTGGNLHSPKDTSEILLGLQALEALRANGPSDNVNSTP